MAAFIPSGSRIGENLRLSRLLWLRDLLWRGGLPPLGGEATPCALSNEPRPQVLRLLRSRTGASPLATASPLTTGERRCGKEGGFTYLGVLFLIVLMGMGLASAGELWSTASRRDRERQLLWVGTQYAQALRSYYRSSPGLAQYPKDLADLLQDERFPSPKHHLRQLYPDPIGGGEWTLMRGFDGRITGLYSPSTDTPIKQTDFPSQWSDFVGMASYKDWQFVAEKAFLDGASGPKPQSSTPQALAP